MYIIYIYRERHMYLYYYNEQFTEKMLAQRGSLKFFVT